MLSFKEFLTILGVNEWKGDQKYLRIRTSGLLDLVRHLLDEIQIDEFEYLAKYPDVKTAIDNNDIPSAKEHYIRFGYLEGRTCTVLASRTYAKAELRLKDEHN